jgi:hypothetical protein
MTEATRAGSHEPDRPSSSLRPASDSPSSQPSLETLRVFCGYGKTTVCRIFSCQRPRAGELALHGALRPGRRASLAGSPAASPVRRRPRVSPRPFCRPGSPGRNFLSSAIPVSIARPSSPCRPPSSTVNRLLAASVDRACHPKPALRGEGWWRIPGSNR